MSKPAWHFWLVAALALAWNAISAADYWAAAQGVSPLLKYFEADLIDWLAGFPLWRKAFGAIAFAAGILGGLSLLLRRRVAVILLLFYFALMVFGFAGYDILIADGAKKYGTSGLVGSAVLIIAAALQWIYADRAAKRGHLV